MVGSVIGNSCFVHSPLCHFLVSESSRLPFYYPRNAVCRRKNKATMACLQENSKNGNICNCTRRAILFVGFGLVQFLGTRADAVDGYVVGWNRRGRARNRLSIEKNTDTRTQENTEPRMQENTESETQESTELETQYRIQNAEQTVTETPSPSTSTSSNPTFSVINSIGVLSSGVLAALYSSTMKEKATSDATIESVKTKLKEKEAAITSLEKKFESKMLKNEEARNKDFARANEMQQSLINRLNTANEKKMAFHEEQLGEREKQFHEIEERLIVALDEVKKDGVLISNLTQENQDLSEKLEAELKSVKILEQELKIALEMLEKSRNEASDLSKQLQKSRSLCLELEAEVSKVKAEFTKAWEALQREIDESKEGEESLAGELLSVKELLGEMNEKLRMTSQEMAAAEQKCDSLEKELIDASRKAEAAAEALMEERKIVSSLNYELLVLETEISRNKEAHKILEADLEATTRSLGEKTLNESTLLRNLESANSTIFSLEDENNALHKSLDEQKQANHEARKNLEYATNVVMELGKELESLEKRGKKLQQELAYAKGEILQLKSGINASKTAENNQNQQNHEAGGKSNKKVYRRRKETETDIS
ncbi:MAR-binding filament-like protein 1-1 isoform X4 [Henckelia pumila]|uniref:MAR-binding filament-like protein 1-1 isoform X4 n=1 Tax=Henckelia pumila TaxID=405737 RepID=UPI003C6DF009